MEEILATIVTLVHGLVVLPVLIIYPIALLFMRNRVRPLEALFLAIGALTAISFITVGACFLTVWEQQLLAAAGLPTYTEGFVRHYLGLVGIDWPDIWTTWLIRICVAVGVLRLIQLQLRDRWARHVSEQSPA